MSLNLPPADALLRVAKEINLSDSELASFLRLESGVAGKIAVLKNIPGAFTHDGDWAERAVLCDEIVQKKKLALEPDCDTPDDRILAWAGAATEAAQRVRVSSIVFGSVTDDGNHAQVRNVLLKGSLQLLKRMRDSAPHNM